MIRRVQAEYLRRLILKLEELIPEMLDPDEVEEASRTRNRMLWHWTRLSCSKWKGLDG